MRLRIRPALSLDLIVACVASTSLAGCHSAFVRASVVNHTGQNVELFEVDYPSASFGAGNLADGARFPYRFKIIGDGPVKVTWTDHAGKEHQQQGPSLHEGEEGSLSIVLNSNDADVRYTGHATR